MDFPSNEQMLNDLDGKTPPVIHAFLGDSLAQIEAMEARQACRMLPVGPDGMVRIPKPRRYVTFRATGG